MNKDELKLFKRVVDVLEEYADTYEEAVEEGHYKLIQEADKVLKKYATKGGSMNQDKTQVVVEFLRDIRTDEKLFSQLVHRESFAKLVSAHVVDFREDVKRREKEKQHATN